MKKYIRCATAVILIMVCIPTSNAIAAGQRPDSPIILKVTTKGTSKTYGTVTVRIDIASSNRAQIIKSEVNVGNRSCVMRRTANQCTVRNMKLGSKVRVRARSQSRSGFSGWSDSVNYRIKAGFTWSEDDLPTGSSGAFVPTPVFTFPTTTTSVPRTTSSTSSTTTSTTTSTTSTTLPFCLRNPIPLEQTVFGRAWLMSNYWNIPGADQASRYGAYPSATMQPSRCQTFSFTGLQARATGSTGNWSFVAHTIVTTSTSAYARVFDSWGINMDFRYVFEVYNMSTQRYEVTYVWKSPYSCGYTCTP